MALIQSWLIAVVSFWYWVFIFEFKETQTANKMTRNPAYVLKMTVNIKKYKYITRVNELSQKQNPLQSKFKVSS